MSRFLAFAGLLGCLGVALSLQAQSTPFTFQGRVTANGSAFNGAGQFKFAVVTSMNGSRQATATPTISGGFLTVATVNDGGAGYVSVPAVTVQGGGGAGAVLTAHIGGGAVTSITVNNPGGGYTSTPSIVVAPPADSFVFTTYWSNDGTSVNGSEPASAVNIAVANGLFSVEVGNNSVLNMQSIAADVFTHPNLQLRVWFSDGSGFTALNPPQRLTYAPYAAYAINAASATAAATALSANTAGTLTGTITSANIPNASITSDKLAPGAAATNLQANGQVGIASGGIVLSASQNAALVAAGFTEIGTTQLIDRWKFLGTGAVTEGRAFHSTIWTGTEMIVWGGTNENGPLNTGGRYNPTTGVWTALPTANAPIARYDHSAIWTGTEMIVWGGYDNVNFLNSGGRYNPTTNTWAAGGTSTTNAPLERASHAAVWTGSEMIVWGGGGAGLYDTGGRYNPAANTWSVGGTAVANAPSPRYGHTAVWTGTEMIIWGGYNGIVPTPTSGGRYNPANDTWVATSTVNVPLGRTWHTAVWTGTEMIVWGGGTAPSTGTLFDDGGRYDPSSNSWTAVSTLGAPSARCRHTAVWSGSEMIIWGGADPSSSFNNGSRYRPSSNTWSAVTLNGAPTARANHSAVWTGSEMLAWGGFTFSTFNDTWSYDPGKVMFLYQKP